MWDLSPEYDTTELARMQNREQPELLAGSPPSDDFSSLLNACLKLAEINVMRTEI